MSESAAEYVRRKNAELPTRGQFTPCAECDRPELCAILKPHTPPCWAVSDDRLEEMIQWLEQPVIQRERWSDDTLTALKELRRLRIR